MTFNNNTSPPSSPKLFHHTSPEKKERGAHPHLHGASLSLPPTISFPYLNSLNGIEMAPTKLTDRETPAVVTNGATGATAPLRKSRFPSKLRLPLLVSLSLLLRSVSWTAASDFTGNELGQISRKESDSSVVFAHLAYKIVVLWVGWGLELDCTIDHLLHSGPKKLTIDVNQSTTSAPQLPSSTPHTRIS